jgi:hypothetical protein
MEAVVLQQQVFEIATHPKGDRLTSEAVRHSLQMICNHFNEKGFKPLVGFAIQTVNGINPPVNVIAIIYEDGNTEADV